MNNCRKGIKEENKIRKGKGCKYDSIGGGERGNRVRYMTMDEDRYEMA